MHLTNARHKDVLYDAFISASTVHYNGTCAVVSRLSTHAHLEFSGQKRAEYMYLHSEPFVRVTYINVYTHELSKNGVRALTRRWALTRDTTILLVALLPW